MSRPQSQYRFYGLHYLDSLDKVYISPNNHFCACFGRSELSYTVTDVHGRQLYEAVTKPEEDYSSCFCEPPKGPRVPFRVTLHPNRQHLMDILTNEDRVCCLTNTSRLQGKVTFNPDISLGTFDGEISNSIRLRTPSGDKLGTVKNVYDVCCSTEDQNFQIIPTSQSHDTGNLSSKDRRLLVNFPTSFDVANRALLLSCAISVEHIIEEDRRRTKLKVGFPCRRATGTKHHSFQ